MISSLLVALLNIFVILLIIRAIASWFQLSWDNPLRRVIDVVHQITDPVVLPVRRVLPSMGGLDLSVLLIVLFISFIAIPLVSQL
ncbi:MAG: YggT family protein [Actinomycetota bacterium]